MVIGLRFKERMAGWICFDEPLASTALARGTRYPFEINLHVFTDTPLSFTKPRAIEGYALLLGSPLASAASDEQDAPRIRGTLTTTIRGVAYDFGIEIPEAGRISVKGTKKYAWGSFSLGRFLRSLVTLPLEVWRDGRVIGRGELVYRNPLWKFPLTMRLARQRYAFDDKLKISERLAALAPVFIASSAAFIATPDLVRRVRLQLQNINYLHRKMVGLCVSIIALLAFARFGRRVGSLNDQQREKLAGLLQRVKYLRELALPVSVPVLSAAFGARAFLEKKLQHIPTPAAKDEQERWMALNTTPTASATPQEIEVDVVVVGSGAGGAAAAYELASQGHAVAIVEEGHYYKRSAFTGNRIEMMNKLFRNSGQSFALSNAIVWTPTGKCVGGTTTINSGTCFRLPDAVLERWRSELGLRTLDLSPYYDEVERMLDVKPTPSELQGPLKEILLKGLQGTPYKLEALRRAETGCDGQSFCILGCPTGAKRSTDVSYVPEAMKKNAHLYSHYQVAEILFDGDRAVGVRAGLAGYGREFELTIKAKAVVLAAGTFNTPALLWRAGLHRELKQLGKNLTMHPAITVGALFPQPLRQKFFVPQSLGVLGTGPQHFVLEGYTLSVDSIPLAMSVYGLELDELMLNAERFVNFSGMIEDVSSGSLLFTRSGTQPYYYFNREIVRRMKHAASLLTEIFVRAGAEVVYTPVRGFERLTAPWRAGQIQKSRVSAFDFLNVSAHHPLGTCRMGSHAENSVVSPDGLVWGRKGLYVVDGSAIPGPLGVNPQVTIMANALRVARKLGQTLT